MGYIHILCINVCSQVASGLCPQAPEGAESLCMRTVAVGGQVIFSFFLKPFMRIKQTAWCCMSFLLMSWRIPYGEMPPDPKPRSFGAMAQMLDLCWVPGKASMHAMLSSEMDVAARDPCVRG